MSRFRPCLAVLLLLLACSPDQSSTSEGESGGSDGSTQAPLPTSGSSEAGETTASTGGETGDDGTTAASSTGPAPDPVCGDGVVQGDEPCDDGNAEPDDGCDAQCARTGVPIWTQSWDGGADRDDFASAVRMDAGGDIFVAGSVGQADTFSDAIVRRLDAGGVELAQYLYDGAFGFNAAARALALDGAGGVVLGGVDELVDDGRTQAFVRRFSADGEVMWTYTQVSPYQFGFSNIYGVAAADDAIYVSGVEDVAQEVREMFVHRLDPADGQPLWTVTIPDAHLSGGQGLAIAPNGDVILASATVYDVDTPAPLIVRLAPADGAEVWNHSYFEAIAYVRAVAVHPDGDLAIVGGRYDDLGDRDVWTARLTGAGDVLWSDLYDYDMDNDAGVAVAWSPAGDLYIGALLTPQGEVTDAFVRRYTGDGEVVWTSTYDDEAGGRDGVLGVAVGDQQVVVVGIDVVLPEQQNQWIRAYEP